MRHPEKIRLKSGVQRWQLRYEDVHRRIRYKTFATRRDAEAFMQQLAADRAAGIDPGRVVRFAELATEWTDSHLAHGLRSSSVKHYKQALRRMAEFFGERDIRAIRAADLERCRNALVLKVQAERTEQFERVLLRIRSKPEKKRIDQERSTLEREPQIREEIARGGVVAAAKVVGCARTLWKFAVARGYVPRNVALDVKKPSPVRVVETGVIDQNILNPVEIERLIGAAPAEHRCTVRFLFMTGVRFGELTGLMWSDIDWASSRVLIRRQRSAVTGELTVPKTKAGTRWIDLPADLILELKTHRLRTPGEFVFPIDDRNWRSRVWHAALRRAGLRSIRIHDARHTHASLLIASGADVVAVSRRLGHADPSITLHTYSHSFDRRGVAPLGELLAAFMRRETFGGFLVVPDTSCEVPDAQAIDLVVARGGIEPPTRGFSVRCSTN